MKVKCTCQHEGQDKLHGKGVRIANPTAKGSDGKIEYRCTVCKTLHRK